MDVPDGKERGSVHLQKQRIGVFSAAILIFSFVAAGAFGLEESVYAAGPGITLIMLVVLVILWALPYCFCVSELSSLFPGEGGEILWARHTLGEFWSFQYFFWYFLGNVLYIASLAALSVNYLGFFWDMSPTVQFILKMAFVLLVMGSNLRGFKEVTWLNTALSIFLLSVFALITVVGFMNWTYNPFDPIFNPELGPASSIGTSLAICIWMYAGWAGINQMGGEVKDRRTIPRAFMVACPLICLSYFLPLMASIAAVGNWDMWSTELAAEGGVGFASVLYLGFGTAGAALLIITAICGNTSSLNVSTAAASRSLLVMADYNMLPETLNILSKNRKMPWIAIVAVSALTAIFAQLDVTLLIICSAMSTLVEASIAFACLVRARKMYPLSERPEDMSVVPGGKFVFVGGVISVSLVVIATLFLSGTDYYILAVITAVVPVFLYFLCKRKWGGLTLDYPLRYPGNPKTKLCKSDLKRFTQYFTGLGLLSLIGPAILYFVEGDSADYYLEEYGTGLLANYELMLYLLIGIGVVLLIIAAVCFVLKKKYDNEDTPGVVISENSKVTAYEVAVAEDNADLAWREAVELTEIAQVQAEAAADAEAEAAAAEKAAKEAEEIAREAEAAAKLAYEAAEKAAADAKLAAELADKAAEDAIAKAAAAAAAAAKIGH